MSNTRARNSDSELVTRHRGHVAQRAAHPFAKKGYDRVAVRAIAAAYGTATGSVYNYGDSSSFGSQEKQPGFQEVSMVGSQ